MFKWPNGNTAVSIGYTSSGIGYGVHHFYTWKEDGTYIGDGIPAVIQPQWILTMGNGLRGTTNNYYAMGWKFKLGEPYTAKFKLVENIYKSQRGDKSDEGNVNTTDFSGKFADGTDFDYKLVVV